MPSTGFSCSIAFPNISSSNLSLSATIFLHPICMEEPYKTGYISAPPESISPSIFSTTPSINSMLLIIGIIKGIPPALSTALG